MTLAIPRRPHLSTGVGWASLASWPEPLGSAFLPWQVIISMLLAALSPDFLYDAAFSGVRCYIMCTAP